MNEQTKGPLSPHFGKLCFVRKTPKTEQKILSSFGLVLCCMPVLLLVFGYYFPFYVKNFACKKLNRK